MPLVVSLTSEKNGGKTLQYASGHISASRNQSSSRFPERAPGPNICGGAVRAAGTRIALPAKRVKQDATKGEVCAVSQDFRPVLWKRLTL